MLQACMSDHIIIMYKKSCKFYTRRLRNLDNQLTKSYQIKKQQQLVSLKKSQIIKIDNV